MTIVKRLIKSIPLRFFESRRQARQGRAYTREEERPSSFDSLLNEYGVLKSSAELSTDTKRAISIYFDFRERAYVAMSVAQIYPGGDYFEFGSEGMGTFRNFLTACDLTSLDDRFPDTHFYAFDIFGDMTGASGDLEYFKNWHDANNDRFVAAQSYIKQHGLFLDRCHLVKGFFASTLTPEFKQSYLDSGKRIGFAFLDCNITNSYQTVFEFLKGMLVDRACVYMDEYFCNPDVPMLFSQFCSDIKKKPLFVRNAGLFGALFQLNSL